MNGPDIKLDGETIKRIGKIGILLLVSVVVIGSLMGAFAPGEATNQRFSPNVGGETVDNDGFESATVMATTGYGAEFSHQGGNVQAPTAPIDDSNASVVGWVRLDEDAAAWREYFVLSYGDNLTVQFDEGEWLACADVPAGSNCVNATASDPYDLTMVGASVDGQNVSLIEGGDEIAAESLAAGNGTPVPSDEWFGTIDEVRTYSEALGPQQRSTLNADPVAPVSTDRTARLMFDEGSGDETWVLSQGEYAAMSGDVGWGDGVPREELVAGQDYEIDMESGEVSAIEGGRLDGVEVGYITYGEGALETLGVSGTILGAFNLAAVAVIVMVASVILFYVGGFGGTRRVD